MQSDCRTEINKLNARTLNFLVLRKSVDRREKIMQSNQRTSARARTRRIATVARSNSSQIGRAVSEKRRARWIVESIIFAAPGICRRARRAVIGRRRRAADRHVPRDHARAAARFRAGEALQRCASCGGRGDIAASCICVLYFGPHCPETGLKVDRVSLFDRSLLRSITSILHRRHYRTVKYRHCIAFRLSASRVFAEYSFFATFSQFLILAVRREGVRRISQTWWPAARW